MPNGTPMIRDQFENITNLGLALRTTFNDQLSAVTEANVFNSMFNVQSSARAAERSQGVGGFGDVPEYNGTLEYDSFELLYRTTYTHKEYALGMSVARDLIDDEEYGVINQRAAKLGLSFDRTVYTHQASVFNNAFSSSYVGADAVALCSDSHPLSPSQSGSTQDNKGTSALTHDSLIAAKQAMRQWTDSRGNPDPAIGTLLLVPTELMETAEVIVNSGLKSGSANNDANVNSTVRVASSVYLTDANNWFLIDERKMRMYLNWFWRVMPEFAEDPTSDYNLQMKYRGYMRFSYGWDNWNWIYGSEVS